MGQINDDIDEPELQIDDTEQEQNDLAPDHNSDAFNVKHSTILSLLQHSTSEVRNTNQISH